MWASVDGELVAQEQAHVPALDRGFLYGDGVFETLAVFGGQVFRLERHVERFFDSCHAMSLSVPFDRATLTARIQACIEQNAMQEGMLRFSLSRGRSTQGLDPGACVDPTFLVLAYPPKRFPDAVRREGAPIAVSSVRRVAGESWGLRAKTCNYIDNILAYRDAIDRGAAEAVMLNGDGEIAEGAVSNLFFVRDGHVVTPTPSSGALPGVTREAVLELCGKRGLCCSEKRLRSDILDRAQEVFYTNSGVGIMPVGAIDARRMPAERPITRELEDALAALIERESGPCWYWRVG